jgi:hypothetical protein
VYRRPARSFGELALPAFQPPHQERRQDEEILERLIALNLRRADGFNEIPMQHKAHKRGSEPMGATRTGHHKPENIRRLEGAELPAHITTDGQHVIVKLGQTWKVFQRTAGLPGRRSAARRPAGP